MKTITLSAEESLIEAAEERARREHTTLDAELKNWLAIYAGETPREYEARRAISALQGKLKTGGAKFTREVMNAR